MQVNSLIELLDAAADTKFVNGPFEERGGIMIVGPPGSFKTTIIETALEGHSDAIICSDMNVQQWLKMKDEFVSKRYTLLAFPEFEKLFQRHPAVASNLEGIIKALVSEGFGTGPGGDQRMPRLKARALVVGGMTPSCFERNYESWQRNGFLRRFIWLLIGVADPETIVSSIRKWEKIEFGKLVFRPANRQIRVTIKDQQSRELERMMKTQPGLHGTAYVLMKKILAVLQWKYPNDQGRILRLLKDVAPAMGKHGDLLILKEGGNNASKVFNKRVRGSGKQSAVGTSPGPQVGNSEGLPLRGVGGNDQQPS